VTPLRALAPGFDPAVVATIDAKLAGIAEREQVDLLIAVENGSRAWGFPRPTATTTAVSFMSAGATPTSRCLSRAT
jgi:hypothetical protein